MAQPTLRSRVDSLEITVRALQELPAQVARLDQRVAGLESQIVELGSRMGDEFSAIRGEMASELAAVRSEMATKVDLAAHREETKAEFAALREEVVQGDQETRRYMRMLFEDYVGRLRIIREGDPEP